MIFHHLLNLHATLDETQYLQSSAERCMQIKRQHCWRMFVVLTALQSDFEQYRSTLGIPSFQFKTSAANPRN